MRVVTGEKLKESDAPEGTSFHIHVVEHGTDEVESLEKSGKRVVNRLNDHGILGEKTIFAHATRDNAREVVVLAESGMWITHQSRSNTATELGLLNCHPI